MEGWSYEKEWFEETNVARKIRDYLQEAGYRIIKFNEDKRQKGPDIVAEKDGLKVVVEVKGYPSDKYVRGEKKGEKKPTNPNLQAKHWFSEVPLKVLLAKSENTNAVVGMGFPKFSVYEKLIGQLEDILRELGLICYLVDENGKIVVIK